MLWVLSQGHSCILFWVILITLFVVFRPPISKQNGVSYTQGHATPSIISSFGLTLTRLVSIWTKKGNGQVHMKQVSFLRMAIENKPFASDGTWGHSLKKA